jgi:hypothetical protein
VVEVVGNCGGTNRHRLTVGARESGTVSSDTYPSVTLTGKLIWIS